MTAPVPSFAPAHAAVAADRSVAQAARAGVVMQTVDDVPYDGRHAQIDGQTLLNFGSCSYLGLEQRPELKRGAIDATERFGTQFSYSRVFLQLPLYTQLENLLGEITGGYALVAPTTTLGHIAALPVLIEPGDAAILDKSAHASLHTAAALLRSMPVEIVAHNRLALLEQQIARLSEGHRRVWYIFDGLYSMVGDLAPIEQLSALLEKYPKLHLYVDEAHCTSWMGKHGRGFALDRLPDVSRVVVALGFAKAFGVGGAALIFANDEDRQRVRRGGGPLLFSGPIQPPLLGAAIASAKLHLDPSFAALQEQLTDRIAYTIALARQLDVPLAAKDPTPIFFVRCGPSELAFELVTALRRRGIYVCCSAFPAVPHKQAGARFTISVLNTRADIEVLMTALAEETRRLGIGEHRAPRLSSRPPRAPSNRPPRGPSNPPARMHSSRPPQASGAVVIEPRPGGAGE